MGLLKTQTNTRWGSDKFHVIQLENLNSDLARK